MMMMIIIIIFTMQTGIGVFLPQTEVVLVLSLRWWLQKDMIAIASQSCLLPVSDDLDSHCVLIFTHSHFTNPQCDCSCPRFIGYTLTSWHVWNCNIKIRWL